MLLRGSLLSLVESHLSLSQRILLLLPGGGKSLINRLVQSVFYHSFRSLESLGALVGISVFFFNSLVGLLLVFIEESVHIADKLLGGTLLLVVELSNTVRSKRKLRILLLLFSQLSGGFGKTFEDSSLNRSTEILAQNARVLLKVSSDLFLSIKLAV